ncbi:hypothetical protein FE634_21160 [Nocardioides dongxiaopingii]|nr:hypothetical protein FE634_21160 [Nocardioides sp. S-1144]
MLRHTSSVRLVTVPLIRTGPSAGSVEGDRVLIRTASGVAPAAGTSSGAAAGTAPAGAAGVAAGVAAGAAGAAVAGVTPSPPRAPAATSPAATTRARENVGGRTTRRGYPAGTDGPRTP